MKFTICTESTFSRRAGAPASFSASRATRSIIASGSSVWSIAFGWFVSWPAPTITG